MRPVSTERTGLCRRSFLAGSLAASLVAHPANAAQTIPRLVVVYPSGDEAWIRGVILVAAMIEELARLGYSENRQIRIDVVSGHGQVENFSTLAKQVVASAPDILFIAFPPLIYPFQQATKTIPIVAATADPVRWGLVQSLNRPGGNITGVTVDTGADGLNPKRIALLHQVQPSLKQIGFLGSDVSKAPDGAKLMASMLEQLRTVEPGIMRAIVPDPVTPDGVIAAFREMHEAGVDALLVSESVILPPYGALIAQQAAAHRWPAMYPYREYVDRGGLMSFGINSSDLGVAAARSIVKILTGTPPGEIPMYQPRQWELIINQKAAAETGLVVPAAVLAQADELIER